MFLWIPNNPAYGMMRGHRVSHTLPPKEYPSMKRALLGHPLRLLLSGLMLTACGAPMDSELAPDEAPAPAEELGVKESASCTGSSVSALAISGFSS